MLSDGFSCRHTNPLRVTTDGECAGYVGRGVAKDICTCLAYHTGEGSACGRVNIVDDGVDGHLHLASRGAGAATAASTAAVGPESFIPALLPEMRAERGTGTGDRPARVELNPHGRSRLEAFRDRSRPGERQREGRDEGRFVGNDIVELPGSSRRTLVRASSRSAVASTSGRSGDAQHQEVVRGVSRQDTGALMNK